MRPPLSGALVVTQLFGGNPAQEAYTQDGHVVLGHTGIDISANVGDLVYPAWPGTAQVQDFGNDGFGKHITLTDDKGRTALYGHLSEILVNDGERVQTHVAIGKAGSTGYSTGPHVHFQIQEAHPNLNNGYLGCRDPLGGFDSDVTPFIDLSLTNYWTG